MRLAAEPTSPFVASHSYGIAGAHDPLVAEGIAPRGVIRLPKRSSECDHQMHRIRLNAIARWSPKDIRLFAPALSPCSGLARVPSPVSSGSFEGISGIAGRRAVTAAYPSQRRRSAFAAMIRAGAGQPT